MSRTWVRRVSRRVSESVGFGFHAYHSPTAAAHWGNASSGGSAGDARGDPASGGRLRLEEGGEGDLAMPSGADPTADDAGVGPAANGSDVAVGDLGGFAGGQPGLFGDVHGFAPGREVWPGKPIIRCPYRWGMVAPPLALLTSEYTSGCTSIVRVGADARPNADPGVARRS